MENINKSSGNLLVEASTALLMVMLIFICGNVLGKALPRELPEVDSVAINLLLPKGSTIDVKSLTTKQGLGEMLMVYSLAAIDSSSNRTFSPKDDITMFFSIADALPNDGRVKMFHFRVDNTIEMDYIGTEDGAKKFCNRLGLTGRFSTVYYTPVNNTNTYTIYAMAMEETK